MNDDSKSFRKKGIILIEEHEFVGKRMIIKLLNKNDDIIFYMTDCQNKDIKNDFFSELVRLSGNSDTNHINLKQLSERVIIIPISGYKPSLGITSKDLSTIKSYNIKTIWHMTDINFQFDRQVYGMHYCGEKFNKGLVQLAKMLKVNQVNYVSSAYDENSLCSSEVKSEVDIQKKAEQILIENSKCYGYKLRIIRIPIIVNDCNSFESVFSKLLQHTKRFLDFVKERQVDYFKNQPLKILKANEFGLNIIEIDEAVKKIIDISEISDKQIEEINIVRYEILYFDQLLSLFVSYIPELKIVNAEQIEELNLLESIFLKKISFLAPYCTSSSRIHNHIGDRTSEDLLNYDFGKLQSSFSGWMNLILEIEKQHDADSTHLIQQMKKHIVRCGSKPDLEYYTIGEGPPVLIANGLGPNNMMWKWVLLSLHHNYKFIIWETRGLRQEDYYDQNDSYGYKEWAKDIECVIDNENIEKCNIVGFCAGNKNALTYYKMHPERVKSMILITGEYTNEVERKSLHKDSSGKMAEILGKDPHLAEMFLRILSSSPKIKAYPVSEENQINIINQIDPRYLNYIRAGILNKDGLLYYCKYCRMCAAKEDDFDCAYFVKTIDIPTLIISAAYDYVYNPDQSKWLNSQINGSRHIEYAYATHWLTTENWEELSDTIDYFLKSQKGDVLYDLS